MTGSWLKQHWLRLAIWLFIIIPTVPFVVVTLALIGYTYWPINDDKLAIELPHQNSDHLTVLIHGLKDDVTSWAQPLQKTLEQQPNSNVLALNWQVYAQDVFRCSTNGIAIGERLAAKILNHSPRLNSVHLVAHSCGSFVALGACRVLKQQRPQFKVHSTYLEPVSVFGAIFWDYGIDNFGQCSDFSDAYIDTRDRIPGSNQALTHAVTFDVTAQAKIAQFNGRPHQWPIAFYQNLVQQQRQWTLTDQVKIQQQYSLNQLYPWQPNDSD